jgi:hypothetical protein
MQSGIAMRQYDRMNIPVGAAILAVLALLVTPVAQAQTVTIQFTSVITVAQPHDTKPAGPSKGDSIDFKDLLLNRVAQFGKAKSKPVAWDAGTITYKTKTLTTIMCLATFPGVGTITYGGRFVARPDGTTVVPVISGTGAFKGVTGTVTIGKGQKSSPNTYLLHVPHAINIHARGNVA